MTKSEMKVIETNHSKAFFIGGFLLISFGFLPVIMQYSWLNIIVKIREAIITGDSGHLILASASINFFYSIQSTFLFMGTMIMIANSKIKCCLKPFDIFIFSFILIIFFHMLNPIIFQMPWEPVSTIIALIIALYLFDRLYGETNSFLQVFIVSVQVFFAIYWLNIIPFFSPYRFGQNDIHYSIKIVASYLSADTILNFVGFAFFIPFIISAFISATLFISYSQNINFMRVNYAKENELRDMKAKALENRIYQEVNSLVHDLKTPLVTIRGLNSLLISSGEQGKWQEYSVRIENSVAKMNEMISCFLYETSRQRLKATELISYIRAQLPLEDEKIKFSFVMDSELDDVYVNKIRVARAIINILENAIIVPCNHTHKEIKFEIKSVDNGISILIQDNGIGINELDIPYIWDVGYSTNNTSGLGLPFAKRIIDDNNGRIKIESQSGKGTIVTIFLPSAISYKGD